MSSLVFPAMVRAELLRQHTELRSLLSDILMATGMGDSPEARSPPDDVPTLIRCLFIRFQSHLAYEDDALRPILSVLDAWGPERLRDLDEDHARQRQSLKELLARLEVGANVNDLAVDLRDLAADLLSDMEAEEQGSLSLTLMTSDYLTAERR